MTTKRTKPISEYGPNGRIARKRRAARNWGWRKALRAAAAKKVTKEAK